MFLSNYAQTLAIVVVFSVDVVTGKWVVLIVLIVLIWPVVCSVEWRSISNLRGWWRLWWAHTSWGYKLKNIMSAFLKKKQYESLPESPIRWENTWSRTVFSFFLCMWIRPAADKSSNNSDEYWSTNQSYILSYQDRNSTHQNDARIQSFPSKYVSSAFVNIWFRVSDGFADRL